MSQLYLSNCELATFYTRKNHFYIACIASSVPLHCTSSYLQNYNSLDSKRFLNGLPKSQRSIFNTYKCFDEHICYQTSNPHFCWPFWLLWLYHSFNLNIFWTFYWLSWSEMRLCSLSKWNCSVTTIYKRRNECQTNECFFTRAQCFPKLKCFTWQHFTPIKYNAHMKFCTLDWIECKEFISRDSL